MRGKNKKLAPAEHARRLELYRQGLNDGQMAAILGLSRSGVQEWRVYHNIPPNFLPGKRGKQVSKKNPRKVRMGGVPMTEVLPPEECETVRQFLRAISYYSKQRRGKIDAGAFISKYRRLYGRRRAG